MILIIFIFLVVYFLKEPFISLLFKNDFNLKDNICNYDEEFIKLKDEYDKVLQYQSKVEENIISKVIFNDPLEFFEIATIIKGKTENVSVGDLVINEFGLVGVISKVDNHTSKVFLLPNKNTHIAVHIGEVDGLLTSENGNLIVKNLTRNNNILVGSEVTVSNYSLLESGLLVGHVKEIKNDEENLSYSLLITPAVDFNNLNYVTIRKNDNYE